MFSSLGIWRRIVRTAWRGRNLASSSALSAVRSGGRQLGVVSPWSALLILLAATSCAFQVPFPMRNSATGQQVTCLSPYTRIKLGGEPEMIVKQCLHACERHGFKYFGDEHGYTGGITNPYEGEPPAPDERARPYVPDACLP